MSHLNEIKESFQHGRLIPFVGAGFSMCIESSPSWEGVLRTLANKLIYDPSKCDHFEAFDGTPWERLEFYVRLMGSDGLRTVRQTLEEQLKEMEEEARRKPMPCQEALTRNFRRIYTTNYDHLSEMACEKTRRAYLTVCSAHVNGRDQWCRQHWISDTPERPQSRIVQIVKFHGDYGDHKSMVLTESNYYDRLIDVDAKDMMFMRDLLFYDILFLGYSLRDPNLKYVLHQMKRLKKEIDPDPAFHPRFFLATPEDNISKTEYFEKVYGIKSVCIETMCTTFQKSGRIKYEFDKPKRQGYLDRKTLVISQFSHLWNLAENADAKDKAWNEAFEEAFDTVPINDGLRRECRKTVRRLLSRVQTECYKTFLRKVINS